MTNLFVVTTCAFTGRYYLSVLVFNFSSFRSLFLNYEELLVAAGLCRMLELNHADETVCLSIGKVHHRKWLFPNGGGIMGVTQWLNVME